MGLVVTPHDLAQVIVRANDPSSPRCGKPAVNSANEPTGACVRYEGHVDYCTASASEAAQEDGFYARSMAKEGGAALAQALLDAQARLDRLAAIEVAVNAWRQCDAKRRDKTSGYLDAAADKIVRWVQECFPNGDGLAANWIERATVMRALASLGREAGKETGRERFARIVKAIGPLEATVLASAEIPPEWRKDEKDGADDE